MGWVFSVILFPVATGFLTLPVMTSTVYRRLRAWLAGRTQAVADQPGFSRGLLKRSDVVNHAGLGFAAVAVIRGGVGKNRMPSISPPARRTRRCILRAFRSVLYGKIFAVNADWIRGGDGVL